MQTVLVVEEDTLIRELMREHLEHEGYVVCAVSSVRAALDATRWTRFLLVLLDFNGAASSNIDQLDALRAHGAPVLMMRSAPAGTVIGATGEIEQVVWSPFDLTTLTRAVHRFLPIAPATRDGTREDSQDGPVVTKSGTYRATRSGAVALADTMPAPPDEEQPSRNARVSLRALGALVLESTDAARRRR